MTWYLTYRQMSRLQLCVLPFQSTLPHTRFKCHQSNNRGRTRGDLGSFTEIPYPCATEFPLTLALQSVWSRRPRCHRCSSSLNHTCFVTPALQNAKNSEVPCCSEKDNCQFIPCHSHLLLIHAYADKLASFLGTAKPYVPGQQLELGQRDSQNLPVLQGHAELPQVMNKVRTSGQEVKRQETCL